MYDDEIRRPAFDLGDFRYAVAGYVRLLIMARMKRTPDFLTAEELERWDLPHPRYDDYPDWRLLEKAAEELGKLNDEYLSRCGSGGVAPTDDSTPKGRVICDITELVPAKGGGPYHNGWLKDAANRLQKSDQLEWWDELDWPQLSTIRDNLDELPHPRRPGPWSRPRSPKEWCDIFSVGWDTLKPLFDNDRIRNRKLTTKLYRVSLEDLPSSYDDTARHITGKMNDNDQS